MADISDVEQALVDVVTSTLYPSGASQPSIVGLLCRIYRGWPNALTLNSDLGADAINVTIASDNAPGKTTTRYLLEPKTVPALPGTVIGSVGQTISISGTPRVGDVVGALIDGVPFAYRVQNGDAPAMVASQLGALVRAVRLSSVQNSTISVAGATSIVARVVADGTVSFESRRQEKDVRIICWCANPMARDSVASAIDAAINQLAFLSLVDGSEARIFYRNTESFDQSQNALLYRRDLVYNIEYPTITSSTQAAMLFGASNLNGVSSYG